LVSWQAFSFQLASRFEVAIYHASAGLWFLKYFASQVVVLKVEAGCRVVCVRGALAEKAEVAFGCGILQLEAVGDFLFLDMAEVVEKIERQDLTFDSHFRKFQLRERRKAALQKHVQLVVELGVKNVPLCELEPPHLRNNLISQVHDWPHIQLERHIHAVEGALRNLRARSTHESYKMALAHSLECQNLVEEVHYMGLKLYHIPLFFLFLLSDTFACQNLLFR